MIHQTQLWYVEAYFKILDIFLNKNVLSEIETANAMTGYTKDSLFRRRGMCNDEFICYSFEGHRAAPVPPTYSSGVVFPLISL